MNRPAQPNQTVRRRWVVLAITLLIGMLAVRLASLQGIVRPVRIAGGSMAASLVGATFRDTCGDCGFDLVYDAAFPPADARVVCSNCGHRQSHRATTAHRGQRVLIDRWTYHFRRPRRWDIVALRSPEESGGLAVKRIVGLPGEELSIADGDLFADGRIVRKSMNQLRTLAIQVHDDGHRPPGNLPSRWQPATPASGWRADASGYRYQPAAVEHDADWLLYHHWRCLASPHPRTDEYPVLDGYGYNQDLSRQLHRVSDLRLSCRIQMGPGPGALWFWLDDGRDHFVLQIRANQQYVELHRDSEAVLTAALPTAAYARGVRFEVAICDQQLLLSVDGQPVIEFPYEAGTDRWEPTSQPLRIGAAQRTMRVDDLRVSRDIYYLDPLALGVAWSVGERIESDQYFVVGDNLPLSRDSRHWPPGSITRARLIGRVLP